MAEIQSNIGYEVVKFSNFWGNLPEYGYLAPGPSLITTVQPIETMFNEK